MLVLLLAFQIAAGSPSPSSSVARDSVSTISRLRQEASDFVWVWRFYWEASESVRHGIEGELLDPNPRFAVYSGYGIIRGGSQDRLNRLHCHPDGREGFPIMTNVIPERHRSLRAVCPEWGVDWTGTGDERVSIDEGLINSLKSGARLARGELIANLERGAHELPGDPWIAGQRTRFAVDQQDWDAAMRAANECHSSRWWCSALDGYVLYASGHAAAADSAFEAATKAMPQAERCGWNDLTWLIDESAQNAYRKIPCDGREAINTRIWWLADPLYTEARNERRAEHYSRLVLATLRSAVEPAERWNWREGGGGYALRQMIVRYGWPSYSWWGGPGIDASHYRYLGIGDETIQRLGVFTTIEYNQPRFHTVPSWSAINDPWDAPASAWNLTGEPADFARASAGWWPQEHYARDVGALISIDEQQTGFLRRHDALELAVATNLSRTGLGRGLVHAGEGSLIVTSAPDSMSFTKATVSLDSTAVWKTLIQPRQAIVGLEVRAGDGGSATARTRFGIEPPLPLSVMGRGDIAISAPILMAPPLGSKFPDSDPATALSSMLGTTRLRNMSRVGIYWETYGIPRGDSVDVAIAVERRDSPNVLRRLGTFLHLASPPQSTVTIRWHEPAPGYVSTSVDGPEPIQARNVSIDLTRLAPGKYAVTVSVTRTGQTASAEREFEILPP